MPPKSEPVPSAQAPKPHGILKNVKPSEGANVDNRCVAHLTQTSVG